MKLFKYRSVLHRDLLTIVNNQIYASSVAELNDPSECMFDTSDRFTNEEMEPEYYMALEDSKIQIRKETDKIKSNYGIISFCKSEKNELMWAYYGNDHKGFCIEYDIDILQKEMFPCYLLEIKYQPSLPTYNFRKCAFNRHNTIKSSLGVKSTFWIHEKEMRLIVEGQGLKTIPTEAITGIYFGLRMPESDKELIKNSLKGRSIKYYQIKLKPDSYLLEVELIN